MDIEGKLVEKNKYTKQRRFKHISFLYPYENSIRWQNYHKHFVFSSFLIIKQTKSVTVGSWHEEHTSHFFNNLKCLAYYGLLDTNGISGVFLCVVTIENVKAK